jgi:Xaa-Pro aminopeptidase
VRPGNGFHAIHDTAVRVLAEGMVRLGLIEGPVEKAIADETFRTYYMHKTSHWLGMDVHDAGKYRVKGEWRTLAPGMVLTVEPGLYVGEFAPAAPEKYRNIGVRIEDDVLVTAKGRDILTADCPKRVKDVEDAVLDR